MSEVSPSFKIIICLVQPFKWKYLNGYWTIFFTPTYLEHQCDMILIINWIFFQTGKSSYLKWELYLSKI